MMVLNLMVSNLISHQGEWDTFRISELFSPSDATRILSFPPSIALPDSLI